MFDFVHGNKRIIQIVLLLVTLPFALWGISSYRHAGNSNALATVDGERITQSEFDNAMRQQQDQMRKMTHTDNTAMFERPEVKQSILDNLVSKKLLEIKASSIGLTLSDDQLAQIIEGFDAFQENGKFDEQRYKQVLSNLKMTPAVFEQRVRLQFAVRQMTEAYTQNGFASNSTADNLIRLNEQQRTVRVAIFSPARYLRNARVDKVAIKNYYDNNQDEFRTPEQARVSYVLLSADALRQQVSVSNENIQQYYDDHQNELGEPEQRRAAHILIAVSAQASDADKQKARAKAEKILQEVKKNPTQFAELAKKYSDDPGSAPNGGDLGFFGRGTMAKPFEDAAFSLKPGEISGLVQSSFGFHVIKLLAVKPATVPPLAKIKSSIVQKLKLQKASDRFAELSDKFSNTVYEQSDGLKPAAELAKVSVQQSGWLDKGQPTGFPWNEKALQAVFSDDVLNKNRNSEAVEIAPDTLLAVHLLDHKPAGIRPLAAVSNDIRQKLMRQQASEQAVKQGQTILEQLQKGGKATVSWGKVQIITRAQHDGLEAGLVKQVLRADVSKLPVYVGVESAQGDYAIARIDAVKNPGAVDDAKRARYLRQLRQLTGDELLQDYLTDAKKHASVSMTKFSAGESR